MRSGELGMKNIQKYIHLCWLLIIFCCLLVVLSGCEIPLEQQKPEKPAAGMGYFSLAIDKPETGRTILPSIKQDNFVAYTFEFFASNTTTNPAVVKERTNANLSDLISLDAGVWDLYVTAYMDIAKTELAAQGNLKGIAIGAGDIVSDFVKLEPIVNNGVGTFSWNIDYNDVNVVSAWMTITPMAINGMPEQNFNLMNTVTPLTLNTGYYRVVFRLSNNEGKTIERWEILHIYQNMESVFTHEFEADHFNDHSFQTVIVKGNSLAEQLAWVSNNAVSDGTYVLEASADETLAPQSLIYNGRSNITLYLKGSGSEKIVSLASNGNLFMVGDDVTLILDKHITLQGRTSPSNNTSLVSINAGGVLIMNTGSKITGNTAFSGGGVYVNTNATFTMYDGEITGNTASSYGGGVYVGQDAIFTMHDGKISDNTLSNSSSSSNHYGAGVHVAGTFIMNGGEIIDNTNDGNGYASGGGVYVGQDAIFMMNDGKITGNTGAPGGGVYVEQGATFTMHSGEMTGNNSRSYANGVCVLGTFIMNGGKISDNTISIVNINSSNGGGVYVGQDAIFMMNDGKITGNTASGDSSSSGGGVYARGTFTMYGGEISGNTVTTAFDSYYYNPTYSGGGVYVGQDAIFTMHDGKISDNTVTYTSLGSSSNGGGVYAGGTFMMYGGEISSNTTTGTGTGYSSSYGGGVYAGGTFMMYGGEISSNTTTGTGTSSYSYGGGVFAGGTFMMYGGKISGNTSSGSDSHGGGVAIFETGTFHIATGTIYGNETSVAVDIRNNSYYGAALYLWKYGIAQYGNGSTWTNLLDNNYTNDTIRVVNGVWMNANTPALTGSVGITGTALVGQTLTANTGSLGGTGTMAYQWNRNGTAIPGANSSTYILQSADAGYAITVTVIRSGNSGSITSAPTADITFPPLTGTVSITGTAQVGQTLTANTGSLGGSETISYQWKRGTTNIGTNNSTYIIQTADVGYTITVTVTRSGNSGSVTSNPTTAVIMPSITLYSVSGPYYYLGATLRTLPGGNTSYGMAIVVDNDTVYIAGHHDSENRRKACYWQGTTNIELPIPEGATSSDARAITVFSGTVYIAGFYVENGMNKACYWQGTTRIDLPVPASTTNSQARAITVAGGIAYPAGYYFENGNMRACYWQGTTRIDLSTPEGAGSITNAITVANGVVYTAGATGHQYATFIEDTACYWQGTTRIDLPIPEGSYESRIGATAITVVDGTVYTAGGYHRNNIDHDIWVCYWQDTTRTVLHHDTYTSIFDFPNVTAISVVNGIVYTAGRINTYYNGSYSGGLCYWLGTTKIEIGNTTPNFVNAQYMVIK